MAAINETEKSLLTQFRQNLSDLHLTGENNSDWFLVKWLRARELNLIQAEAMLRKNQIWRKENDMDNILTWKAPKFLIEEYNWAIFGADKEGCPLVTIPYGLWDIKKAVETGEKSDYLKYIDRIYENILEVMRKSSVNNTKTITQFVGVYDMAHLSFRQLTSVAAMDALLEGVRRFEANYPETVKTFYIINASRIFTILYGLVKPFLSQRTLDKVRIFPSNPSKWKAALLKNIPADQLPPYFGGNSSFSLKWYESGTKNGDANGNGLITESVEEDFIAVTVDAGEKLNVEHYIKHPNTTMSWSFKTDGNDIGFSLLYENDQEIIPYERVESHMSKQEGSTTCVKPGTYILSFDNTYSRMRPKTLYYIVNISSPEEDDSDEITSL